MLKGQGFTLMEMIIVLIIIAIAAVVSFPNFTTPTEQAKALNAKNNLLAIYSAQKNYYNNGGSYCANLSSNPTCGTTLANLNINLSLNIQDDGTYKYDCGVTATNYCTATRNLSPSPLSIKVALTLPIQLTGGSPNPACTGSNLNWCP
jgi:prepilin-type N-terminal cleavage/methylation domain-containing protein